MNEKTLAAFRLLEKARIVSPEEVEGAADHLRGQVNDLLTALRKHGQHFGMCAFYSVLPFDNSKCDCGLRKILEGVEDTGFEKLKRFVQRVAEYDDYIHDSVSEKRILHQLQVSAQALIGVV